MEPEDIRGYVRDRYAGIARQGGGCCSSSSCCGAQSPAEEASARVGYTEDEMKSVPPGSNLGLGCGNPTALASLKAGETVLDLGSGAGFDCFLAAREVGPGGKVIGVDMTPEMIRKARENARAGNHENVEFRLGEIEHLPVADNSVDVVISNCVVNLSPDKGKVFSEACRALKPGGRLMISDIVLSRDLPEAVAGSLAAYAGCIAGAVRKEDYLRLMDAAGFRDVRIVGEDRFDITGDELCACAQGESGSIGVSREAFREAAGAIISLKVYGRKP